MRKLILIGILTLVIISSGCAQSSSSSANNVPIKTEKPLKSMFEAMGLTQITLRFSLSDVKSSGKDYYSEAIPFKNPLRSSVKIECSTFAPDEGAPQLYVAFDDNYRKEPYGEPWTTMDPLETEHMNIKADITPIQGPLAVSGSHEASISCNMKNKGDSNYKATEYFDIPVKITVFN